MPWDSPTGQETIDPAQWREWGLGVDCHSKFLAVCILIPDYRSQRCRRIERRVPADFASIRAAKAWGQTTLREAGLDPAPFTYCLESTACYHIPVIHAWGGEPCLINPTLAGASKRKTDKLDAKTLAYNHMTGLWPRTWFPDPTLLELRCLDRVRRRHHKEGHRALMSIGAHLLTFGYTFTSTGSLNHQCVRPHIEDLITGKQPATPEVKCQWSHVPLPESVRLAIQDAYRQHDAAKARAEGLLKQLLARAKGMAWPTLGGEVAGDKLLKVLTTIPGVGPVTALTWLLQVADPTRFVVAKQLTAYCGFDPSLKVSAGNVTAHVRRKGNKLLHTAIVQAANSVLRRQAEPLGCWGMRIARKGKGGWQKAVGAIGRRISAGLYYCHMHTQAWDWSGYKSLTESEACPGESTAKGPKAKPKARRKSSGPACTPGGS